VARWRSAHVVRRSVAFVPPGACRSFAPFIEGFNRTYRTDILDAYVFDSPADVAN
jgi:hypothetical protein